MSGTGRTPLVLTPTKSEPRRNTCRLEYCPCHDFQTEYAATLAVDSDMQTTTLISWLSGASTTQNNDRRAVKPIICPNRLNASIEILNSIRDASRFYLEAPAPATSSEISSSRSPKGNKPAQPNFNDRNAYEDSFPSLASPSSASPPTLLVGRKKSKNPKIAPSLTANGKMTNRCKQSSGRYGHEANIITNTNVKSQDIANITNNSNSFHMTASGSSSALSAAPSSHVSQSIVISAELKNSCSISNNTTSPDGAPKGVNENLVESTVDPSNLSKLNRLVLIYGTILRSQLAPSLLLELHLLLRLISLPDKRYAWKTGDLNGSHSYNEIFQSERSCRVFAAKTLSDLESVIINLGHETIKMLVAFPALQMQCLGLCETLQDIICRGNSSLIFDADRKALGHNTNTPHLTLPFDYARDSRHNYRSVQKNMIFTEREQLRDSFLFQLRAFQDVRGRLMEQEKNIISLQHASREILNNISPGNMLWFVNFLCDLLLQTGLAPISETDSEVLRQIGDKKRLQVSLLSIPFGPIH